MSGIKVFVGSLPPGCSDATISEYFGQFGQILNAVIKSEQRYGFVFYATMEEAQEAIDNLNGYLLDGAALVVKLADKQGPPPAQGGCGAGGGGGGVPPPPPPAVTPPGAMRALAAPQPVGGGERVYLKGLPAGMTDTAVRDIFGAYGTVNDTKVLVSDGNYIDGTGQSVAIIRMGSEPEAKWLVDNLNGNIPQGLTRPVEVSYASKAAQAAGGSSRAAPYQSYGGGAAPHQSYGGGKGAGPGLQQAAWGVAPVPPPPPGGKGKGKAVVPGIDLLKSQCTPGCKLYVKGLPVGADELYLYKVFSPWARLVEAVALPKGGYTIGFVTCLTEPEAAECIANINGVALTDGATLQVAVKTAR